MLILICLGAAVAGNSQILAKNSIIIIIFGRNLQKMAHTKNGSDLPNLTKDDQCHEYCRRHHGISHLPATWWGAQRAPVGFSSITQIRLGITFWNFQYLSGHQFYASSEKNLPEATQGQKL